MSTEERDTHFFNAAQLLVAELEKQGFITPVRGVRPYSLIAHFAYDLVYYLLKKAPSGSFDVGFGTPEEIHEMIAYLPDMDAWPEH